MKRTCFITAALLLLLSGCSAYDEQISNLDSRIGSIREEQAATRRLVCEELERLSSDILAKIDMMEDRIKLFSRIKMDEMSGEEMRELKALIEEMEDWVAEADILASEGESMSSEMQDLLDDMLGWSSDVYDMLEGVYGLSLHVVQNGEEWRDRHYWLFE